MQEIRVLRISFQEPISARELPAFRGAVINAAGKDNILFHNHTENGFRYHYPLIQYKRIKGKPVLMCLNEGVEEVYEFFRNKQQSLDLKGRSYEVRIEDVHLNSFLPEQTEQWNNYSIINWLALNQQNYHKYKEANEVERIALLQDILAGNVKAFAKGIDWWLPEPLELELTAPPEERLIRFKNKNLLAFKTRFRTNVKLPNFIGLGKSVSTGYGAIKQMRTNWTNHSRKEAVNK